MDKSRISHNGYRYFMAIKPNLPKECAISEQKVFINNLIKQNVKIKVINIKAIAAVNPNEVAHITYCRNSHHKKLLFDMIEIENYLVDELHVMLRITDRLWSLVICEKEILTNGHILHLWVKKNLNALKNENTDPIEFQSAAKAWLNYFLTLSIGNPEDSDFIKGLY
ncbi:hypothetical protein RhiirA4_456294 [Rhizophagus irregularis]|uniref:Uncharacterized protein n=1 Tax=Rhizophagus irregularis TaxID=588596 RepID=A0A2I1G7B9_9GLOM|nr:hypothetical protein RhiirA4_456294 [Rhizophagus irregularis]